MSKDADLKEFPFIPDNGTRIAFHQFEDPDIASMDDVNQTLVFMFNHQEHKFYYYVPQGYPINIHLKEAIDDNWLIADEFVNFNYRHPDYPSTFINIKEGHLTPDNEARIVNDSEPYTRFTLQLTGKCIRKLEIDQLLYTQSKQNENPLELKPNFMGFGIDLLKIPRWIRSMIRKLKT